MKKAKKTKKARKIEPDEKNEDKVEVKVKSTENRQTIIVFIAIIILFLSFLVPYIYFQNQKVFNYDGLTWQVEKDVDVTFYHTQFDKKFNNQTYGKHNTFFRVDPRENDVPVEVSNYSFYRNIIITTSPEVLECDKQILVTDALYQVTLAMPIYNKVVSTATTDKDVANETNQDYITCINKPLKSTVIEVEFGNESKITQDYENRCYKLTLASCEDNFKVSEKFILEIIKKLNEQ